MSRLFERLLTWLADVLDRSVLTVQKVDDEWPPPVGRNGHPVRPLETSRRRLRVPRPQLHQ
jgi:hypothetical protein